jgi:hypothetical protein
MTFAVHNLHAPSVEWDGSSYSHNGKDRIKAGAPIFTADTREEAEEWRLNQIHNRDRGAPNKPPREN